MKETNMQFNREDLQTKYNNSRVNLLLVVAFTVINIILLITNSNTYFLFSAYIPYMVVSLGMMFCGMLPQEFYGEDLAVQFFDESAFPIFLAVALIGLVFYFISWIFSKNNKGGWLIVALIIFSLDTLGLLVFEGFSFDNLIDIAIHAWVIVSLSISINAWNKLKKLPMNETDASTDNS